MNVIETRHLTKYYGRQRGIEDVCLTVEEGSFFGFIGPNGAGKSTTIRTLLGLIRSNGGSASVLGMDILVDRNAILAETGYLPAEAAFYSGMKVKDVLRLSADLRKKDCADEAKLLCERLELDLSRKIDELSLGNRKKVGIVCALQHRPRLYILDEPTGGLDPLMQREFYTLLQERNAEGATVFLSSHVLSEIQRYCTHTAVIRDGSLLVFGRVEELVGAAARRVSIRGVGAPPALDGIRGVKRTADSVSFLYTGQPKALLQALAALPISDVTITEPDLEEIFFHYYAENSEKGGEKA